MAEVELVVRRVVDVIDHARQEHAVHLGPQVVEFDACHRGKVDADREQIVPLLIARRDLLRVGAAREVVAAVAEAIAETKAPVPAAGQHVLAGVKRLAVAAVEERCFAVGLRAVGVPRRGQQIRRQEGEARPVQRRVRPVDYDQVRDDARIDLAERRVDVQARLRFVHAVGAGVDLAGMIAADPRVEVDRRGLLRADAGRLPGEFSGRRRVAEVLAARIDLRGRGVRRPRRRADGDLRKLVDVEVQQVVDLGGIGAAVQRDWD